MRRLGRAARIAIDAALIVIALLACAAGAATCASPTLP